MRRNCLLVPALLLVLFCTSTGVGATIHPIRSPFRSLGDFRKRKGLSSSSSRNKVVTMECSSLPPRANTSLDSVLAGMNYLSPSGGAAVAPSGKRIVILITGCFVGFMFFLPNAMMSDAPADTTSAVNAANLGIAACVLFVLGGVVGCALNTWKALLPGAICQLVAFVVAFA